MRFSFVIIIIYFIAYCSSGFYKRERIYLSQNIAIYFIDEEDYPDDKNIKQYLTPIKAFPDTFRDDLKTAVLLLKVEKEGFFSKDIYPLLYPQQLEQILQILNDIIPNMPERKRILIVQKFDPFRTVLSKDKRTTMLLWYDEEGYNIVLGESHEDLIPDTFTSESNWLEIFPVSLKNHNPRNKILKEDFFEYKIVGDFTHYTWIVFSHEKIANVKLNPDVKKIIKNQNAENTNQTIEERLIKLKELYDKKLISSEEYERRKKEILSEL